MRAEDIDLRRMLSFQPEAGKLLLGTRRMLIFSQRSLGLMKELLADHVGHEYAQALFSQFGFRCGLDDYAEIALRGDWDTERDRVASGPVTHMWEGIVHVEPTKIEFDRERGHFHMTGNWRSSYEAENHLAAFGPSPSPVCASLTGYATGWATAFFGAPVLAVETACQGRGDPCCAFEIRARAAWGPEAEPWRKALEATDESIARILEERILVRTRELEAAREAAEAATRAKSDFLANISHELRTPLALMLGPMEDALATPGAPLDPQGLALVHRNAVRLLRLVDSLLEFSRLDSGRAEPSFLPADLCRVTSELVAAFRPAIERAGLRFDVELPSDLPPVLLDTDAWEKIVFNLLSNALKHTFAGSITCTLRRAGEHVECRVTDTGIGIAPDDAARIFERFHRVRDARSRTHEGSGVGLALVRELAEQHRGTARVESTLGRGSTFVVSLPLGDTHLPPERVGRARPGHARSGAVRARAVDAAFLGGEAQDEARSPQTQTRARTDGHVLVAEDNADLRAYLVRLLRDRYEVTASADGREALASARARVPDLVLSDVMMPNLDGVGLLRALRADARTRGVPVVLLSARAGEEAALGGLEAGADDYLIKPFTSRELLARVRTHLELARTRRALLEERASMHRLESVGRIAAGVAHNYNNILQPILGGAELLLDTPGTSDAVRDIARDVSQSALRAAALTRRILSSGHGLTLRPQPCDLGAVVRELEPTLRPLLGEHIALEVAAPRSAEPLIVRADRDRLGEVVADLVLNAREAVAAGGTIRIVVDAVGTADGIGDASLPPGRYASVSVLDDGVGMAPETLARVFEPFFTTRGLSQATGLGLSAGLGFARQSGGTLRAESQPGEGSRFVLVLPLAPDARPVATTEVAPVRSAQASAARAGATVLVVDDEAAVLGATRQALERLGYRVLVAPDGAEAIRLEASGAEIDLVLTDVVMPRASGLDVARHFATRRPGTPVVLMSGLDGASLEAARQRAPVLAKPFALSALEHAVRTALERGSE